MTLSGRLFYGGVALLRTGLSGRQEAKTKLKHNGEIDLAEIWSYLAEEASESVATEFLHRIEKRFRQALQSPFSGAPRPHLASGLRVIFFEEYAIYYLPHPEEIIIVRVLDGSPEIASIAGQGGFSV